MAPAMPGTEKSVPPPYYESWPSELTASTGCLPRMQLAYDCYDRAHIKTILGIRRSTFLLLLYIVFYVTFLVFGALTFIRLEGPDEAEFITELREARSKFLLSHQCVSDAKLEEFIIEIIEAHKRGVSAVRNVTMEPNWSFGQALFFAATIVTTIGYGHVTPLSEGGKTFCMLYSLMGIPLTLVLLTAIVERLLVPSTLLLQYLNARLGHLYQPFNIRVFHLSLLVILTTVVFYIIPAAVLSTVEDDWTYLDSLYYCLISLTTIGLGDYIPGDKPDQPYRLVYKICITVYLMIGLTFMMLVLTVFYDIPQLNFGLFFLLRSDESTYDAEKMRLHGAHSGPKYQQHMDEARIHAAAMGIGGVMSGPQHIKVKPRSDASSPEDGRP